MKNSLRKKSIQFHSNPLAVGRMKTKTQYLIIACILASAPLRAPAQVYVPSTITFEAGAQSNRVHVNWTTTPGKNYDVLTAEQPGQPRAATNATIKARTTLTNFTDTADRLRRLYCIREEPTPPGNTGTITPTTIAETEKILGLTFTPSQRSQMLQLLTDSTTPALNRAGFESMRTNRLLNSDPPALVLNPVPKGFAFEQEQRPISWSPPCNVTLPTNTEDLAFCSMRDLGELIRTRQLTSTALTSSVSSG